MIARTRMRRPGALWSGLLILLAAWELWPVFQAQQLEGYTASLQAMAIMNGRGDLMRQDLLLPIITEFLYYSRPGMVALLSLLDHTFGNHADDWSFRALMIVSLAGVLLASIATARRVGGLSGWSCFIALLMVPGVSEASFFFNDNLPSAALATIGLALAVGGSALWRVGAGAALIALASLVRLDALLLAPGLLGVIWLQRGDWRLLLMPALVGAAAGLTVLLGARVFLHATLFDGLLVAQGNFLPHVSLAARIMRGSLFFGLPGLLLLAVGLYAFFRWPAASREEQRRRMTVLVAYPAVFILVSVKISSEIRYIYPLLSPFVALFGGMGVEALGTRFHDERRRMAQLITAAIALLWLAPPVVQVIDGPRSPTGRVWMPLLWHRWQHAVADNLARVDALVANAKRPGLTLVINTNFNDDGFLKERLISGGFDVRPVGEVFPGCSGFSVYSRNGAIVAQVRTHNNYALGEMTQRRFDALMLARSLSCRPLMAANRAVLTVYGSDLRSQIDRSVDPVIFASVRRMLGQPDQLSYSFAGADLLSGSWSLPSASRPEAYNRQRLGMLRIFPLGRQQLVALRDAGVAYLPTRPAFDGADEDRLATWNNTIPKFAPHCRSVNQPGPFPLAPLCIR